MFKKTFLALLVALTSCASMAVDTAQWTEEVVLSDGRTTTVWRMSKRSSNGFPVAPRGKYLEHQLRYEPLSLQWDSNRGTSVPLTFDIIEGRPYLVAIADKNSICRDGQHRYAAQLFIHDAGSWREVGQDDAVLSRLRVNLYQHYWGHSPADDASGLIQLRRKETWGANENLVPLTEFLRGLQLKCDTAGSGK